MDVGFFICNLIHESEAKTIKKESKPQNTDQCGLRQKLAKSTARFVRHR